MEVFGLGLSSDVRRGDLTPLVSEPISRHVFTSNDLEDAAKVVAGLVPETCIAPVTGKHVVLTNNVLLIVILPAGSEGVKYCIMGVFM